MSFTAQEYQDAIRRAKDSNLPKMANALTRKAALAFPDGPEIKNQSMMSNADSAIMDNIIGAGETALTMATGATGGALGMIEGSIEGIGKSMIDGTYGTTEGAKDAQRTAFERAGQLTYEPRSKKGQQFVNILGELTENIPIIPTIAPQVTALQQGLRAPMRGARLRESTAESVGKVPVVGNRLQNIVSKQEPGIQVFTPNGQLTPEAMRVIAQNNLDTEVEGLLTPDQAATYDLFVRYGYQPLRPDVTGNIDDQRSKIDAQKRESPVAEVVAGQERRTAELYDEQIKDLTEGANEATDFETGSVVFNVIDEFAAQADEAIGAAYNAARDRAGVEGRVISLDNLVLSLRSKEGKNIQSGGVVDSIKQDLINKGVAFVDENGKLRPAEGANRLLSIDDVEDLRQELNVLYQSSRGNAGATELIRTFKNLMDDSVEKTVGSDIFKAARAEKTKYERTIERSRKNKRDKSRKNLLVDILESRVEPDQIMRRLAGTGIDDFKGVLDFLKSADAGEAGQVALNNIKANFMKQLIDKSTKKGLVKGDPKITFGPMLDFVNSLRKNGKFDELFNADEKQFIADMLTIAKARQVDEGVAQGSGPSGGAIIAATDRLIDAAETGVAYSFTGIPAISRNVNKLIQSVKGKYNAAQQDKRLIDLPSNIQTSIQEAARQPAQQTMAP